jgi:mono/diheme cytochrome c family protein
MNLLPAKRELRLLASTLLFLAPAACGHHFEPPDRSDRVAEAEGLYSAAIFDSLTWSSDDDRALAGNGVYVDKCRKCHGPLGIGDTEYAQGRGLEVPSLVELDWDFSGGLEAVRRYIFVGHENGMPTWGVAGLSPREIDSTAFYVIAQLRPEILQQD